MAESGFWTRARSLAKGHWEELDVALERWSTRHGWPICVPVAVLLLVLLTPAAMVAAVKPLWHDEIYGVLISRFGSFSRIWTALESGVDLQPPLYHLVTHAAEFVLGQSELADRLPSLVGFWLAALCLFRFVSVHAGAAFGMIAAVFPLAIDANRYAWEARPYGLLLACTGLALVSWQTATARRRRGLGLVGLWLSLSLATCVHYYAVLLFVPFVVGEAVRTYRRRQTDWPVWISLMLTMPVVTVFLPLIRGAMASQGAHPWNAARLDKVLEPYSDFLQGSWLPLAVVLALALLLTRVDRPTGSAVSRSGPPAHEVAAAIGLTSLPVVGYLIAVAGPNMMTRRYFLPLVLGFAILFAWWLWRVTGARAWIAFAVTIVLALSSFGSTVRSFNAIRSAQDPKALGAMPIPADLAALPVVVSPSRPFLECWFYAPSDLQQRLVYVADVDAALRIRGTDASERSITNAARFFGFQLEPIESFRATHTRFLIYSPNGSAGYVLPGYVRAGARVELVGLKGRSLLFLVTAPG